MGEYKVWPFSRPDRFCAAWGRAAPGRVALEGADRDGLVGDAVLLAPGRHDGECPAVDVRRIGARVSPHLLEDARRGGRGAWEGTFVVFFHAIESAQSRMPWAFFPYVVFVVGGL